MFGCAILKLLVRCADVPDWDIPYPLVSLKMPGDAECGARRVVIIKIVIIERIKLQFKDAFNITNYRIYNRTAEDHIVL